MIYLVFDFTNPYESFMYVNERWTKVYLSLCSNRKNSLIMEKEKRIKLKYKVYLFLCLLLLSACNSQDSNDLNNTVIVEEVASVTTPTPIFEDSESSIHIELEAEEEWTYYSNGRFGYTIKYPIKWVAGEEAENGDGKILYIGNPDIDIRVYGGHYMEGISDIYHNENLARQYTKLENGYEAVLLLGKENGKVIYDMVYISSEDIEYHFYAEVSEQFFADNEKILLEVARSLDTPE